MDEKVDALLEQTDWKRITLRLLDYANYKIQRLWWSAGRDIESLPKGMTPEDIVQNAILKVFEGERRWEPEKVPDLEYFMKGVVDSLVSHLVESWANRFEGRLQDSEMDEQISSKSAEEVVIGNEIDALFQTQLLDKIKGDDELETVIICLLVDNAVTPREIAHKTGIEVRRVYKLREKLQRILIKHASKGI